MTLFDWAHAFADLAAMIVTAALLATAIAKMASVPPIPPLPGIERTAAITTTKCYTERLAR